MEILKVLWESGPSTLGEVCEAIQKNRPVAKTTIATTLGVMLSKGLVKRRRGRNAYIWSAKIDEQKTARQVARRLVDQVFDGSARQLVAHLIDSGDLSEGDLVAIRRLMDDYIRSSKGE
ncbi:MAG: BlaI/MecI/CopY family transcriptional regulator [Planctomycetota bacterium]